MPFILLFRRPQTYTNEKKKSGSLERGERRGEVLVRKEGPLLVFSNDDEAAASLHLVI